MINIIIEHWTIVKNMTGKSTLESSIKSEEINNKSKYII